MQSPDANRGDAIAKAIILLPFLALAACDSGDERRTGSAQGPDVDNGRSDAGALSPGKWSVSGVIDDISLPDVPADAIEEMKRAGTMTATDRCLTPADATRPPADFFTSNKRCRYDHFSMNGGRIDARMRCETGSDTQLATMTGTYGPDQYRIAVTTAMEVTNQSSPMQGMTMRLTVAGKRVGECGPATAPNQESAP